MRKIMISTIAVTVVSIAAAVAGDFKDPFTHSSAPLTRASVVGEQADITTTLSPTPNGFKTLNRYSNGHVGYGISMCAITTYLDDDGAAVLTWADPMLVSGARPGYGAKVLFDGRDHKMSPEDQERVKFVQIQQLGTRCP